LSEFFRCHVSVDPIDMCSVASLILAKFVVCAVAFSLFGLCLRGVGIDSVSYHSQRRSIMSITPGSPAPDSTWQVAWRDGSAVTTGDTISLSDYAGQVVVLLLTDVRDT
jgi:hypothetical protein